MANGTGEIPSPTGEALGAFRFICTPSHLAYDDPIVFPNEPGRAHLHQFFGNTAADANSTYESLRTSGKSTCQNELNRSAYWIPALLDGRGSVVLPEAIAIYYKRPPANASVCADGQGCIGLPRGLRYVFGRTMQGELEAPPETQWFDCQGNGARSGHYTTFAEAAQNCPSGALIGALVVAPECWNGRELDSADHRSHMAHGRYDSSGVKRCPSSHPYRVPTFTLGAWYETDNTLDRSGSTNPNLQTWHFSSDRMPGQAAKIPGSTFHADWFGAWEDNILDTWLDNCIDLNLSCSGGELGNGQVITLSPEHTRDFARRVPVPARPTT